MENFLAQATENQILFRRQDQQTYFGTGQQKTKPILPPLPFSSESPTAKKDDNNSNSNSVEKEIVKENNESLLRIYFGMSIVV